MQSIAIKPINEQNSINLSSGITSSGISKKPVSTFKNNAEQVLHLLEKVTF